ncbi:hypothetical protein THAOC_04160 [Thalassiosira oceanica]|uniref:Uncharacterized protein n=1 Tax=Thalassiosira oceanica TaxID=159749 RepID=K0TP62_THAOC|nr:hypothetical protein THAOC_04160 [Thalassiosira oceanica]|eukprot:EJK74177.1 hypothetical protein THAOC_04160 [Thalassiosira oceanica]
MHESTPSSSSGRRGNMDGHSGHSQQQSSEDASPPDYRLDEGPPAAADASSTARTASSRGRGRGRQSGQRKSTSSTDAPRRSGRRSLNAGSRSVEHSTAGSSGGGGSIRDSAHDRPRGDEIRTGESYFNIRGSRARGDGKEGPPRKKRKVERTYADGVIIQ